MEKRPDPERLLKRVQEEERQEQRGKLKIYLGAAPGVGKTYAMLQDAITKRAEGLDVVVGVVESHGRREIESLLKDLEILPRQKIQYRDHELLEFDIDAALKRNPGLILIDEMAHTNAPGVRHNKRWQDIKEILDRGTNVYTTLNVQHIESLNDVISQIIRAPVKETIPDSMLELAETVELVDLPPEDLLKRLHEGKIYFPAQAELATENFFRKGNLIALRELALRATAELVEAQVLLYRQGQGIKHIWPTKEKILVCVGYRSQSVKLIRAARRLATNLQAEWIAVHVDAPKVQLSEEQHTNAIQNLRLAEQLGAQTRTLIGFDIVKEIMDFAKDQNISKIMVWKQIRSRWKDFLFHSLADEIIRNSGEIDVYVVTGELDEPKPAPKPTTKPAVPWRIYAASVGIVALASGINFLLYHVLDESNLVMMYLLGITLVSLFGRLGPSIVASLLSVLAYSAFFLPLFSNLPASSNIQYVFTFIVMLSVAIIISNLTIRSLRLATASRFAERHTATLHTLSKSLASTRGVDKLLGIAVRYIAEAFDCEVIALLPKTNRLAIWARYRTKQSLSTKEQSVAQWVYDLGQIAGLGTDTLPFSDALYVPLLGSQGTIGVLRLRPTDRENLFTSEQMHLLEGCANQIALAIEVDRLHEHSQKSEMQIETDRVRSSLLQSISHDLRAPLAAVMGGASTLMELGKELDTKKIKKLGREIYFETEQLNRLINNLLQMTYLEAEEVKLQKEYQSLSEVIHSVLQISETKLGKKPLHITISADLPKIPFDRTLIQEVFMNLLDNAIKFTPGDTPIEISAIAEKSKVIISVEDKGPGIVHDEVDKLFEKFYRGRMLSTERGLGLGLAICRSVITAHGGEIWATNRKGGGAAFCFTLPLR